MLEEKVMVSKRTISLYNLILILLIIFLVAIGIFAYVHYRSIGDRPQGLGYGASAKPHFLFNLYGGKGHLLKSPMTVFVSDDEMIYVANTEGHSIEVFRPNGKYAFSFGGYGSDPGKMAFPYGITQDNDGSILVAESGNARIQVFTKQGRYIKKLIDKESKIGIQKPGPLYTGKDGHIYIGDLISQEVIVIDKNGKKLRSFKGISYPHGLTVDKKNKVYVSDGSNNRVIIYDDKGNRVNTISSWGSKKPFSLIRGIAVDSYDRIFVSDTLVSSIRVFDSNWKYLFSFGAQGMENGNFIYPNGMYIDSSGKVFIADWGNNRIQVWGY